MTKTHGKAQPEALATFSDAAKSKDKVKPADSHDPKATSADLAREQKDAAQIIQAGAEKNPAKADAAIKDRAKVDKRDL